ncbi:hypothetical protein [Candidatus Vidania fulgoroideorum]
MISFFKLHSCKNDFVFIKQNKMLDNFFIKKLSNRNTGIGFDQIFIIKKIVRKIVYIKIYNNDGTLAESCGNGLKCLGFYLNKKYNFSKFTALSNNKYKTNVLVKNKNVFLKIKHVSFLFSKIHFCFNIRKMIINVIKNNIFIKHCELNFSFFLLCLGNPHLITLGEENIVKVRDEIISHFYNGVNVTRFYNNLVTTYERGAGITKSCGTGTTSLGIVLNLLKNKFIFKTNKMLIYWKGINCFSNKSVFLIGNANYIYNGKIYF